MSTELLKQILKNTEVIITLLGRKAFTEAELKAIITHKKRNPDNYIKGYNACDGFHTVTQLAEIVGVDQSTMSEILPTWEALGMIHEVEKPNGKFYKKLFPI